ncbi:thiolase family protein [Sneathiella glossodoripedis]|uniref:thiolase family protein n=1 Tax=Sneathiella glossodoripedis TaxID=418853 RepID=UPI00046EA5E7|nr:thiolase family protein [Sneathiella glossodoripedis]
MSEAFIIAARRTAVMPINGAFSELEAFELLSPVITALLQDADMDASRVDRVIMGNALSGGGNVARVAALDARLKESVSALTVDTQCCAGLDAVGLASEIVKSGAADVIVAGGVESYSRAPRRIRRAKTANEQDAEYERPAFTPWADRDPDMLEAAARLAKDLQISRSLQDDFAMESHQKALKFREQVGAEIVPLLGQVNDGATRALGKGLCDRLPGIAGEAGYELTSANTALKADAAAAVLVVSENVVSEYTGHLNNPCEIAGYTTCGADPENPALAPISALKALLDQSELSAGQIDVVEMMEAFAVQAMVCLHRSGLAGQPFNLGGGALARGHPIGASGAINVVRLYHQLQAFPAGSNGISAIAAAGGLGSAMLLRQP